MQMIPRATKTLYFSEVINIGGKLLDGNDNDSTFEKR